MSSIKICLSDYVPMGYLEGEKITSILRLVATTVTMSIASLWWSNRSSGGKYRLFFVHWLSGVLYLLGEVALEQLVLDCWLRIGIQNFVEALRFMVNAAGNMVAVTNVAICVNLALIVNAHRTTSRAQNMSSPRLIFALFLVASGAAAISIPYTDIWTVTATILPSANTMKRQEILVISYVILETIASVVMIAILAMLLIFRLPEMRQVWKLHRRIRIHFALTAIALVVNIIISLAAYIYLQKPELVWVLLASWCMRYLHIILASFVLFNGLTVPSFHLDIEGLQTSTTSMSYDEELPRSHAKHSAVASESDNGGASLAASQSGDTTNRGFKWDVPAAHT